MLHLKEIAKSYNGEPVFFDFSLEVKQGEVAALVGPTGCGKSTLLRVVAGVEPPDHGIVETPRPPVGFMLQDPLLLPWRSLQENALLGSEVRGVNVRFRQGVVQRYFHLFGLDSQEAQYPAAASGGMRQRVALIRTLMIDPQTLLLDEPFTSLDFHAKIKVQRELLAYQEKTTATILMVTHDIEDAIALSDYILIVSDRPMRIKSIIKIDLGLRKKDPVEARKVPGFRDYFADVAGKLRYDGAR
jgi:NitT/TauT family transport system ATP-binding protein